MKTPSTTHASNPFLTTGAQIAAAAAALCGIHCALTPLVVLVLPVLGLSEGLEQVMFVGTAAFGAFVLLIGPAREHRSILAAFALGTVIWAASLAGWLEPIPEPATSVAGSLLLAASLFWSARLCRSGDCSACAGSTGA